MARLAAGALAVAGCAHAGASSAGPAAIAPAACPSDPRTANAAPGDGEPARVLGRFLAAIGRSDFDAAWRLLASPWRGRYTPPRLAADFDALRALAEDKLARIRASPDSAWRIGEERAELPLAEGKAVRLVREPDGWRVAALE